MYLHAICEAKRLVLSTVTTLLKMNLGHVWLALSLIVFKNVLCVEYYTVISHSNHCPTEFVGEPCLTLNQYVSNPSTTLNITLTREVGNHLLMQEYQLVACSFIYSEVNSR